MTLREISIIIAGALAIISALLTISAKVPLRAAMALLLHIVSIAVLYLTLDSQLLAVIQLLVYAGAIVTLFVFVLMMVGAGPPEDKEGLQGKKSSRFSAPGVAASLLMGAVGCAVTLVLVSFKMERPPIESCDSADCVPYGGVQAVGTYLYKDAAVPFELVGVLLLVAVIGFHGRCKRQESRNKANKTMMEAELGVYLGLSALIFTLGAAGFLVRCNLLLQLMCIELMLGATNLCLVTSNRFMPQNYDGQVFAFLVIAVAAAEAAVGLALVINLYRLQKSLRAGDARSLKH